jgi:hypothetical protein
MTKAPAVAGALVWGQRLRFSHRSISFQPAAKARIAIMIRV